MKKFLFCIGGKSAALPHAAKHLEDAGCLFCSTPSPNVTHYLLDVPTPAGCVIPEVLSPSTCIIGGNLPAFPGWSSLDLLQDPFYVAENASITAHCAIKIAMNRLSTTLQHCRVLVIGWGRIGKCLADLLKALGADVTVAARKEADRAILTALGYQAVSTDGLSDSGYQVIFNTVPVTVLHSQSSALKIDLASSQGILGPDVVIARGLPGKEAPEASGELIARRILHHLGKEN